MPDDSLVALYHETIASIVKSVNARVTGLYHKDPIHFISGHQVVVGETGEVGSDYQLTFVLLVRDRKLIFDVKYIGDDITVCNIEVLGEEANENFYSVIIELMLMWAKALLTLQGKSYDDQKDTGSFTSE